jgi:hypothetical protein
VWDPHPNGLTLRRTPQLTYQSSRGSSRVVVRRVAATLPLLWQESA